MMRCRLLAALTLLALTSSASAADGPGPAMHAASVGHAASCAQSWVLRHIKGRFAHAERRVLKRGYLMASLEKPRASGQPYAQPGLIARDYCMADAIMTNGDMRAVYYTIERGVGFAGIGSNVDFCVLGLDPWHVHDGACRAVR